MTSTPIILVDGSSYFYRAFHALPPLVSSSGQPTGAIYGVVNMIKRLLKDYQPTQLIIVFDAPGKTFRDEWYPDYKKHRAPTPEALSQQFEPLVAVLKAMGLPILSIPGVEADDVIGTLAQQAVEAKQRVLISTGDKDMAQLVNEHVTLVNTMTQQYLDIEGVRSKFGVAPHQIIDYLTLTGDTADHIPGVPQCGPKTAAKWLQIYPTLDELIAHAHTITGKIGQSLQASLPHLPLSKRLVTIRTDVTLPEPLTSLVMLPPDLNTLMQLATRLELKTWLKEWSPTPPVEPTLTSSTSSIETLTTTEALTSCLTAWPKTSTCYLLQNDDDLFFSLSSGPIYHAKLTTKTALFFKTFFEHPHPLIVGYDLKTLMHRLSAYHITLTPPFEDVQLMHYLSHRSIEDRASTPDDTYALCQVYQTLKTTLPQSSLRILHDIEYPLISILMRMEAHGVLIDLDVLATQGAHLTTMINQLEKEAESLVGYAFNLNSPKQLIDILYHEQCLPILAKTPKGQPSTNEAVLQELGRSYRLPAVILEYRSLSKLCSTYIDALPKHTHPETHRIHTSYHQTVTTTGRLSSSEPNLQNIPIRRPEGRLIRRALIAPPQYVLLSADYSQIELRIMAHLSHDPTLQTAFQQGLDIHRATASEIFHTPLDAVTSEQRRRAKAVNFGLIYGMSAFGLSKQLGIDQKQAQQYIHIYFERYPGVQAFMELSKQHAHTYGYVETLFGRRLYIPDIHSHHKVKQKAAERMAINAPLQGTAADLIKKAMIDVQRFIEQQHDPIDLILQVHDELVFEVPEHASESFQSHLKPIMEHVITLNVPMEVSIHIGKHWDMA